VACAKVRTSAASFIIADGKIDIPAASRQYDGQSPRI
jgi:hypothetical protein